MANRFTRVVPKLFARIYRAIWFISRSRHRETHLTRSPTRPTVARGKNRMRRKQEHSEPSRGKLTFSSTLLRFRMPCYHSSQGWRANGEDDDVRKHYPIKHTQWSNWPVVSMFECVSSINSSSSNMDSTNHTQKGTLNALKCQKAPLTSSTD